MERMVKELNERDIGGGMHHATLIQEQLRTLNEEFKNLQNRFCGVGQTNDSVSTSEGRSSYLADFSYHTYDGRHNLLPKNFVLPTLTLSAFISYFILGNRDTGVPPLRLISASDVKRSGTEDGSKVNLKIVTDMKRMMKFVEEAGREAGVWENDPSNWSSAKVINLYEKTKHCYMVKAKKGRRRYEALMWKTYLNILKSNKGLVGDRRAEVEGTAL